MLELYVRMTEVGMGKNTDGIRPQTHLGSWAEFDMKFNEEAVYCSGISHGADTARTFINALRRQEPIKDFSGERLPAISAGHVPPVLHLSRQRSLQRRDAGR